MGNLSSNNIVTLLIVESTCRTGIMCASNEGEVSKQLRSSVFSLRGTGFFRAFSWSMDLGKN